MNSPAMAGIYRQRHPEHTVRYRVFFYYFELSFEAERPPPPRIVQQEFLMAAEESGERAESILNLWILRL